MRVSIAVARYILKYVACETSTPFGKPVVPLVYMMTHADDGSTGTGGSVDGQRPASSSAEGKSGALGFDTPPPVDEEAAPIHPVPVSAPGASVNAIRRGAGAPLAMASR